MRNSGDFFDTPEMNIHILSQDILDNHKTQMIKIFAKLYLKLRLRYEAKKKADKSSIRQKYTKLILFKNQYILCKKEIHVFILFSRVPLNSRLNENIKSMV